MKPDDVFDEKNLPQLHKEKIEKCVDRVKGMIQTCGLSPKDADEVLMIVIDDNWAKLMKEKIENNLKTKHLNT